MPRSPRAGRLRIQAKSQRRRNHARREFRHGGRRSQVQAADRRNARRQIWARSVLILEKMTKGRGLFRVLRRRGAKCHDGTAAIDKAALLDEIYRSACFAAMRPEPARIYVNRSGEATDFSAVNARQRRQRLRHLQGRAGSFELRLPRNDAASIDTELGFRPLRPRGRRRGESFGFPASMSALKCRMWQRRPTIRSTCVFPLRPCSLRPTSRAR